MSAAPGCLSRDGRPPRPRFGADRCVDTPLAEAGILGTSIGLTTGWRPVCEMQYESFSAIPVSTLAHHACGRYRWRTGGAMEFPLTIRMPTGGGVRAPELHEDSPEAYYVHTPGVRWRSVHARGREGPPSPRPCAIRTRS